MYNISALIFNALEELLDTIENQITEELEDAKTYECDSSSISYDEGLQEAQRIIRGTMLDYKQFFPKE